MKFIRIQANLIFKIESNSRRNYRGIFRISTRSRLKEIDGAVYIVHNTLAVIEHKFILITSLLINYLYYLNFFFFIFNSRRNNKVRNDRYFKSLSIEKYGRYLYTSLRKQICLHTTFLSYS